MSRICSPCIIFAAVAFLELCGIKTQGFAQHHKPLQNEIEICGAPSTGPLVEGAVGSIHKGSRHRFFCHNTTASEGFIGFESTIEPLSLKTQPGVFPAPVMGLDSLTFRFHASQHSPLFTPLIIRPDGTVFYGQPMAEKNSPQTVVVAAPAQTGIYTLMIISNQYELAAHATVNATISTRPQEEITLSLKSFDPNELEETTDLICAEFIYTQTEHLESDL
jgi:hypothetical protein